MATSQSTAVSEVEYRDIPGHPGYRVGSDGSVWSCWRQKGRGRGLGTTHVMGETWKRMRLQPMRSGHLQVKLRRSMRYVHHLVLEAFVGPRPPGMEGCHDPDPNPANNAVGNLRWDTHAANARDRVKHGTSDQGERNPGAKLTAEQVREIRAAQGRTRRELAAEYGVSPATIQHIRNRKRWGHVAPAEDDSTGLEVRHLPRLTAEQAQAIREEYAEGNISQTALGEKYGVSHTLVSYIVRGKAWKRVT